MEFNYFDLIVSIVILLLGLKGIINGFFKEIFGLIGIIGGIFIASRFGDRVGEYLSDLIFNFDNNSAIGFTGFLATLAAFWLLMIVVGLIFKRLSSLSGLGAIDKILGFIFGASKFFLITAVIAHAAYNIKAVKSVLDDTDLQSSKLFPILVKTGSFIMKLDPVEISNDINATAESIQNKAQEIIKKSTENIADDTIKQIQEVMPEMVEDIKIERESKE
ncbi:MAG: CvpA family protein [Sulfurimonas sp.]|nr:CvpA family protein [Sulfurimonas sp.]